METEGTVSERHGVYLTAVVIAQDAFRDDRGRTHVIGVFDKLTTAEFPLAASFMVWCNIKGYGTATVALRLIDAANRGLVVTSPLEVEVTPFKGHEWFITMKASFPEPALYKLVALVDDTEVMEVPLMVWHGDESPPPGEASASQN